jgi:hypothetical protein
MGVESRRWRDAGEEELSQLKPRVRKRVEKFLAKKNSAAASAAAVGKGPSEDAAESDAAGPPSPLQPSRRRLFQNLEFSGVCVQNKAGKFPCPTVGKLLERGASLDIVLTLCIHPLSLSTNGQSAFLSRPAHHLAIRPPFALSSTRGEASHATQVMYNVEYDGRTPLFDSPTPSAVTGRFECPFWTQPGPADTDLLIYDEAKTASGYRSVYGSLGDPGKELGDALTAA